MYYEKPLLLSRCVKDIRMFGFLEFINPSPWNIGIKVVELYIAPEKHLDNLTEKKKVVMLRLGTGTPSFLTTDHCGCSCPEEGADNVEWNCIKQQSKVRLHFHYEPADGATRTASAILENIISKHYLTKPYKKRRWISVGWLPHLCN